jgi:hypothetical protein
MRLTSHATVTAVTEYQGTSCYCAAVPRGGEGWRVDIERQQTRFQEGRSRQPQLA